jgi:hypothetical protein
MRRLLLLLTAAMLVAVMAVASAMPAFAHDAGPCAQTAEPGHSEYAEHHVVPTAGQDPNDHYPGLHQGFSFCDPSSL